MRTLKCYNRTIALVWKLSRIHQVNFSPDLGAWLRVIIKLLYSKKRSRKISEETLHPAELNGQTRWAPQSPTTSFRSVLGLVAQSYPTLCDPMDCVPLRDRTRVSCIAGGFFTIWATGEAHTVINWIPSSCRHGCVSLEQRRAMTMSLMLTGAQHTVTSSGSNLKTIQCCFPWSTQPPYLQISVSQEPCNWVGHQNPPNPSRGKQYMPSWDS